MAEFLPTTSKPLGSMRDRQRDRRTERDFKWFNANVLNFFLLKKKYSFPVFPSPPPPPLSMLRKASVFWGHNVMSSAHQ